MTRGQPQTSYFAAHAHTGCAIKASFRVENNRYDYKVASRPGVRLLTEANNLKMALASIFSNRAVLPCLLLLMLVFYVGYVSSTVCSNACNPGEYLVLDLVLVNGTGQCVECPSGF